MEWPQPIPGPVGLPLIGNIINIDPKKPLQSLTQLADTYGDIFKLRLFGGNRIVISSQELVNEICDEKRFTKAVAAGILQIRHAVNDGLFTARLDEPNWGIAHRTLMPAFGPISIHGMFDEMNDIASQLVVKWARFGPSMKIHVTEDFTRLTLDSIALCAMGTRFNSFYRENLHPFVTAMVGTLAESQARATRPAMATYFMRASQRNFDEDIAYMRQFSQDLVTEHKANPTDKKDLMNAMLKGKDPKTGAAMTEESIIDNMITFLIAGHETTSGLLSFLFYYLLKNPRAYRELQDEIDSVIGSGPVTIEHMSKLPYLEACLRETLRLSPSVPVFAITANADTKEYPIFLAGGKYKLEKGDLVLALLPKLHSDHMVMMPMALNRRECWMSHFQNCPRTLGRHPFGNGARGCIGRPFSWQESVLSTALLFQNFNFKLDDPSYQLDIIQTLSIKPQGFYMRAELRAGVDPIALEKKLHGTDGSAKRNMIPTETEIVSKSRISKVKKEPMTILYGSNSGTCEALAQSIARVAGTHGYDVRVDTLDSVIEKFPTKKPVVVICSSYEGQPPDNAAHFFAWLDGPKRESEFNDVKYAVYGVGNHDWTSTFHKVPTAIDRLLEVNGGNRIAPIGLGDVAAGEIFNDFDTWQDDVFWPALGKDNGGDDVSGPNIEIEIDTTSRRSTLRQDVKEAIILSNQVLTTKNVPEKRHITIQLPTGMEYKAGDYLAILPMNNEKNIKRVLKRFGLPWDAVVLIKGANATTLPTAHPIAVMELLGSYVELSQPATKRNIQIIASSVPDKETHDYLLRLSGPDFESQIQEKRTSVLDLLEANHEIPLPFSEYLAMLPPMRIRQYSISSSSLASPSTATITFSILSTLSSNGKKFLGVTSTYLSSLEEGDHIHASAKSSHKFNLPKNIEKTPLIMICAGSGIAPFRAFVQERAQQIAANPHRILAPAYLFIGCSDPSHDALFSSELQAWERSGAVKLYYAYSKAQSQSEDCKYVQDRLWAERNEIGKVFDNGAKIFICGGAKMGNGVKDVIKKIFIEGAAKEKGIERTQMEAEKWFEGMKEERFAMDVFD